MSNATVAQKTVQGNLTYSFNPCGVSTTPGNAVYVAFLILFIIVSICGNALVVFAVGMARRLRSSPTNVFIVSLAVSDLLYSIFVTSVRVAQNLNNQKFCMPLSVCQMFYTMDTLCTTASISNLFVIALDRFLAIVNPFRYQILVSKKKAYVTIAILWHYAVLWTAASAFNWKTGKQSIQVKHFLCTNSNKSFYITSYFVIYIIPLLIMSFTYMTIFRIALAHIRAIRAQELTLPNDNALDIEESSDRKKRKKAKQTRKELKATKTVAVVYGAFVVCWLPSCIINGIVFIDDMLFPKLFRSNPVAFKFIYYTFIEILPILSSLINPFIYGIANVQFREAFKVVILRVIGRHDLAIQIINGDVVSRFSKPGVSMGSE